MRDRTRKTYKDYNLSFKHRKILILWRLFALFVAVIVSLLVFLGIFILYYNITMPDIDNLDDYKYPVTTRLYSDNGLILKEYANEKRFFMEIEKIPDIVKYAFISAEDKNFYKHSGLDAEALSSAILYNVYAVLFHKRLRGASTITQQVVKNILLTNERTLIRKLKEAILAYKITKKYSKDKVLELYLNYIFLGNNSYGVVSACLNYFNKSIFDITIDEAAILASLPKAPAKLNPAVNKDGAIARRNYVIDRMFADGYITEEEMLENKEKDIVLAKHNKNEYFDAGAFTEQARKKLSSLFSESRILNGGILAMTTIKPEYQTILDRSLKNGLESYDRRHGYRGEITNIYKNNEVEFLTNWPSKLKEIKIDNYYRPEWELAVVLSFDTENNNIVIGLIDDDKHIYSNDTKENIDNQKIRKSIITLNNAKWLVEPAKLKYTNREDDKEVGLGDFIVKKITDVNLSIGSVIFVENVKSQYIVKQVPEVNGAGVVMDINTGRIYAMTGGYTNRETDFNRATQALRQSGSAIKPFVYLTAFENGYNGSDTIMDEEIILPQQNGVPPYKPQNYSETYYGLVTLRKALQNSYNVSTVRLASQVGLRRIAEMIRRLNINDKPKTVYSMALGSLETKLINMVNAYGILVNGGFSIKQDVIEKVQDSSGKIIYRRDNRECIKCNITDNSISIDEIEVPFVDDDRKQIIDGASAYQVSSILEGVVKYGTARSARTIGKIIGGKTGTSNDWRDAWYIGFSPELIVGVYVGFDNNKSLGKGETGAKVALPIFIEAMKEFVKDYDSTIPFRIPENIQLKRIDMTTGKTPTLTSKDSNIIYEAFKINDPKRQRLEKLKQANIETYDNNEFDIDNYDESEVEKYNDINEEDDIFNINREQEDDSFFQTTNNLDNNNTHKDVYVDELGEVINE